MSACAANSQQVDEKGARLACDTGGADYACTRDRRLGLRLSSEGALTLTMGTEPFSAAAMSAVDPSSCSAFTFAPRCEHVRDAD